jgi:signal transduction histidine kinase
MGMFQDSVDLVKEQPTANGNAEATKPTLLASLTELQQLLRNSDTRLYWERCAELLFAHTSVKALSLWLFRIHTVIPDVSVRLGKFDSTWLARIQRWEMALRSYSSEEFQATASDDVELGLGRRDEDQPIIHMRLRLDGILLGGVSLVFAPEDLPSDQDYSRLLQFVQMVVDNGLRARQLTITRQRLEQMSLIAQVSQSLNSTLELETVLRDTTEMSAMTLQAKAATLFVVDERNRELIFYMPTGTAGGMLHEMRIPQHQGVAGWVSMNRRSIIVNNVENDPRFTSLVDDTTGFKTRNILCVPLTVQGRLVGVLEVLNKEGDEDFTEEDKNWLEKVGSQAGVALENARLYQNLRNEQDRIIKAQEEVRHQLARDLHDGPAQILSLIIMNVDVARRLLERERFETVRSELDLLEDLGRQANREVRTLLFELRPIILQSRGLIPALQSYHEQLSKTLTTQVHLEVEELSFKLRDKVANNIFTILQESINNIRKHANAQNIWLRVYTDEQNLYFECEDDGKGFDVTNIRRNYDDRGSFGLLNMYERAEMLNGQLDILSPSPRLSRGTLLRGKIPLDDARQA